MKTPVFRQLICFVGAFLGNTKITTTNGTMFIMKQLYLKQNTFLEDKTIKKTAPDTPMFPRLISNRWKEAPKARNRIYPSDAILTQVDIYVNKNFYQHGIGNS